MQQSATTSRLMPLKRMWLCALLFQALFVLSTSALSPFPKVLIVGFDGMRWDYISEQLTPFIWNLTKQGAYAPRGIKNQMITKTAPNFYALTTGLTEENSGIIGNTFYDPVFGEYWDYYGLNGDEGVSHGSRDPKWYTGEFIWQTNDKADPRRSSGSMRWPFCDLKTNNRSIDHCSLFPGYFPYAEWVGELDNLTKWLTDETKPINLALIYNPQPDHDEHQGDIYRSNVTDTIRQLDQYTKVLFERLQQTGLLDQIDIILTADHGHANVYRDYNIVFLEDIIDISSVIISESSLFPKNGTNITEVYNKLIDYRSRHLKFDVYWKSDIPSHWHYRENRRIGPIFITGKLGYQIMASRPTGFPNSYPTVFGQHGWSNDYPEMRPIFVAYGPSFKKAYRLPDDTDVETIDIYPLMAHLLQVTPAKTDGQLSRIAQILISPLESTSSSMVQATTTTSGGASDSRLCEDSFYLLFCLLVNYISL